MATSPVTLDLSKSKPISSGITLDLSKSQPLNNAVQAAPERSLTDRLTEIRPHQPGMSVGQHVATALGNVGAGAMTPILHPVDTAMSGFKMITDPYETMAYPLTHHPSQSMELANSLIHHPAGTIESGIGQAATMRGLSEIPSEAATAPIRGAVKTANAMKRNAPAIMAPTLGTVGLVAGGKFGIPEAAAAGGYGAYKGMQLGKFIQKAPDIPGERFGLPPEPPSFDTTVLPEQSGPMKATRLVNPMDQAQGKYQPPERVPPPVRTAPIERAPVAAEPSAPQQVSIPDQIATARSLGFPNLGEAINRFGFAGWQKYLGQEGSVVAEPPSIRPGSPTPFRSEAPLTPADLGSIRNTNIPTWDEIERQGRKEQFYAQAPQVKTKNQLVNEVKPSMVAKSEANTSPYANNLPTKKIRK